MNDLELFRDHLATIIAEELSVVPDATSCGQCGRPFDGVELLTLDQSPRARAIRSISRVIDRHSWGRQAAIEWLDAMRATSVTRLSTEQVLELEERMVELSDATDLVCDLADAPPAR